MICGDRAVCNGRFCRQDINPFTPSPHLLLTPSPIDLTAVPILRYNNRMVALNIPGVMVEENAERLKIAVPLKRKWVYLAIYSTMLIIWVGMVLYGLIFTWQMAFSGARFAFAFTAILLLFLFLLYRLGRTIWRQWQYYVAGREILFLFEDHLVIRRPVSLLGITTAYDRPYIRPFYYDDSQHSPAFEYGNLYVLFAVGLPRPQAEELVRFLNGRYYPDDDDN